MSKLTARRWGWINFKIGLMIWSILMLFFPPFAVQTVLGQVILIVWTLFTFFGAATGITGLIMETRGGKSGTIGVSVELIGLSFMLSGPLVYFIAQLGLLITNWPETDRLALTAFAWAMVCAVSARITAVVPRFRREATDPTKVV